jgi:hypothetical protein
MVEIDFDLLLKRNGKLVKEELVCPPLTSKEVVVVSHHGL